MSAPPTPEERAEALVAVRREVPGGPCFIHLGEGLGAPVRLGPYENPAVAKDEAREVRRFVAAVIREARGVG
jgi:hypothetical protein